MSEETCSVSMSTEPLGRPTRVEGAEFGVIRYAPSRNEVNSGSDDHSQNERAVDVPRSPSASGSACSSQPANVGTLTAGHFAQRSTSSKNAVSSAKRIRPSEVVSLGSETVGSSLPSCLSNGDSIPPLLSRRWDLTAARELVLRKIAAAVRVAYESVYTDQIELWSDFMLAAVRDGLIPHHPQATPARLVKLSGKTVEDDCVRLIKFVSLLPGFFDLDVGDQKTLLSAKYLITAMLHRSKFTYRGEMYYYMAGPGRIHPGSYYFDAVQMDRDFCRHMFRFVETVNDVGLTLNETYLLLAVALFAPGHARALHKNALGHLHAYYSDALFYMLGTRLAVTDRAPAYRKLEKTMEQFAMIDHISFNFMNNLDLTRAPVRSRSITFSETLRM